MKRYISTTVALLLAVIGFSQHNAMDKYFTKYSANDDYTHITIAGKMFELMTHIDVENEEEQEIRHKVQLDLRERQDARKALFGKCVWGGKGGCGRVRGMPLF